MDSTDKILKPSKASKMWTNLATSTILNACHGSVCAATREITMFSYLNRTMPRKNIKFRNVVNFDSRWTFPGFFLLLPIKVAKRNTCNDDSIFKGAVTYVRYFGRSKFSRSLAYKNNFGMIWEAVFNLGYAFCQER